MMYWPRHFTAEKIVGAPADAVPVNIAAPAVTGGAVPGAILSCTTGTWAGPGPISHAYQWQRGGADIPGETGPDYTVTAADDAASLRCVVTATNAGGSTPAASNPVLLGDFAPAVAGLPVAAGETGLGGVLTVTAGTWTGPGTIAITYQWQRDGLDIAGATASDYTVTAADDAAALRCLVTATSAYGATPAPSNAVTVQDFAAPAIPGLPVIDIAAPTQGQTLTATAAAPVTGNPAPVRSWQWLRGGAAIPGATGGSYTTGALDVGTAISVRQTETNGFGSPASATSAATAAVIETDMTPPSVASATLGAQGAGGDLPVALTGLSEAAPQSYAVATGSATAPDRAQVLAGQDHAGVPAPVALGPLDIPLTGSVSVPLPVGLDASLNWYLVLGDAAGNHSDPVALGAQAVDTAAPAVLTRLPADDATDVAPDGSFAITFDEGMARTGSVTLRLVGGAAVESFDLAAGTGDGGGTAAWSATSATDDTLTLTPGATLAPATAYCFRHVGLADGRGNALPNVTDDTTYDFVTAAAGPTSLFDFATVDAAIMGRNFRVSAISNTPVRHTGTIAQAGICVMSYQMITGLTDGTDYRLTLPVWTDIPGQTIGLTYGTTEQLSAALATGPAQAISTDGGAPTLLTIDFTASSGYRHIGFRTSLTGTGMLTLDAATAVLEQI
ncbi:hypothetical protein HKCCE2091_20785 [Rhodobacterales bacterium HKCCE2091]|nr:hypothetical protein [Rhodobacterales bacterium HKCCE2091]